MNEQRKLRNLLAYTKTDTIEELEDCNKLYEELLAYINKQEQFAKDVNRFIFLDHKNSFELTEAESGEWISLFKKIGFEYEPFKTKGVVKWNDYTRRSKRKNIVFTW